MSRLSKFKLKLDAAVIPDSADDARRMLEEHSALRKHIVKVGIETVEGEGQAILEKICGSRNKSQGSLPSAYVDGNKDLKLVAPKVEHYMHRLHQARQFLLHEWSVTKAKLEQCLQLRMFEQDCEDVSISQSPRFNTAIELVYVAHYFVADV